MSILNWSHTWGVTDDVSPVHKNTNTHMYTYWKTDTCCGSHYVPRPVSSLVRCRMTLNTYAASRALSYFWFRLYYCSRVGMVPALPNRIQETTGRLHQGLNHHLVEVPDRRWRLFIYVKHSLTIKDTLVRLRSPPNDLCTLDHSPGLASQLPPISPVGQLLTRFSSPTKLWLWD